ncbi:hypothetical protein I656_02544 [Geobacillus sp. WSUCF1]|nr:hypothetical protein I656_02544 [Geobacillus sp. WSUCF1]
MCDGAPEIGKKKMPLSWRQSKEKAGCIREQPNAGGAADVVTQGQRPLTYWR